MVRMDWREVKGGGGKGRGKRMCSHACDIRVRETEGGHCVRDLGLPVTVRIIRRRLG